MVLQINCIRSLKSHFSYLLHEPLKSERISELGTGEAKPKIRDDSVDDYIYLHSGSGQDPRSGTGKQEHEALHNLWIFK